MSFFAKLRWRKKCPAANSNEPLRIPRPDSKKVHFGSDQIRILLFRECEQRGRKLLFDSISTREPVHKDKKTFNVSSSLNQNENKQKPETFGTINGTTSHEKFDHMTSEDVGLLSEMVFGTVAMTYRGPSFKIHSIQSPSCIMCTKVFPDSEHSNCKQRDKLSDETLGRSNSSSGSVTQGSRPSSGYFSGNSLNPENVKNSVASSADSDWNLDIPVPSGSNQSLDKSSSSSIGSSISSIRRRWLRAVSTSFSMSETDDMMGYYGDNIEAIKDNRRHKTRLGLTMLIRLTPGCEKTMENKLLEHAALLEGMLDRLRYCCIESTRKSNGSLIERLQKATSCCTTWLLRLFKIEDNSQLLLWHDVLLYSIISDKGTFGTLYQNLEQMCQLLDKLDTKRTNFFLSTFVTAILTHHLGWIRTVVHEDNHKLLEEREQWYPYNPLWAQLGDLHGALGSPIRIVQTVIAGSPARTNLINSVLTFASYFLRSGIVEKKPEERYSIDEDMEKAIVALRGFEQTQFSLDVLKGQNPSGLDTRLVNSESFKNESAENKVGTATAKLKRTGTFQKEMNIYGLKQNITFQQPGLTHHKDNVCSDGMVNDECNDESDYPLSTVRIIVSAFTSKNDGETLKSIRLDQRRTSSLSNLGQFEAVKTDEAFQNEGTIRSYGNFVNNRYKAFHSNEDLNSERRRSVYFTLGDEDVSYGRKQRNLCQCVNPLPSPPKSPKTANRFLLSQKVNRTVAICEICQKNKILSYETEESKTAILPEAFSLKGNDELQITNYDLLANSESSLEELLRQNCIIELPMPKSDEGGFKSIDLKMERVGFTEVLLNTKVQSCETSEAGYIWGMVMQGLIKNEKYIEEKKCDTEVSNKKSEWWWPIQEEIGILGKFPILDQPVEEAVCVLADLDNWQVGLLSNKLYTHDLPLPVGMSRLVSNMLEAFLYIWKKYRSPEHCIRLLETRLREMWLRSEVLAQMLMVANVGDVSIDNITSALDLDAADLPLLLAVATTHTPEIAQRFGLSFA